jgi:hypothetical protein
LHSSFGDFVDKKNCNKMRLFGTFKSIEIYLLLTGIFLLFTFDQLCQKNVANMMEYWYPKGPPGADETEVNHFVDQRNRRPPPFVNVSSEKQSAGAPQQMSVLPSKPTTLSKVNTTLQQNTTDKAPPRIIPLEAPAINTTVIEQPAMPRKGPQMNLIANKTHLQVLKHNVSESLMSQPTAAVVVLAKEQEISGTQKAFAKADGTILPTDDQDVHVIISDRPAAPSEVISPAAIKGLQQAVYGDIKSPQTLSTLQPQAFTATEKPSMGLWNSIFSVFGGPNNDQRAKRNADTFFNVKKVTENHTYVGTYRCEKASPPFSNIIPAKGADIFQQIFAWRYLGILLLFVHLLLIVYHSFVNFIHRVPTSHRFNRVFAAIGLLIWDSITLWIIYQYLSWNKTFINAPIYPDFPAELYAFLILSIAMNIILLYELITPKTFFLSYDITPRHPRRGYVAAATSENDYINGIIRQLESHNVPLSSVETRPVVRAFDINKA